MMWINRWPEYLSAIVLVLGVVMAFVSRFTSWTYVIILLSGAVLGRLVYRFRESFQLPWIIVSFAYVAGFLIGARGNNLLIVFLYGIGFFGTYYVHKKGYLESIEF